MPHKKRFEAANARLKKMSAVESLKGKMLKKAIAKSGEAISTARDGQQAASQ